MAAIGWLLLSLGCGQVAQHSLSYPVLAMGEPPTPFAAGDWTVTLSQAQIGFGPAYFCATAAASSDLCPAAVSELALSVTLDGLNPAPQLLGDADGLTGTIRSTAYDFGFDWFATQHEPQPGAGAPGGHSVLFAGEAVRGSNHVRFEAAVDVVPLFADTFAIQGARVSATLDGTPVQLTVQFSPHQWWEGVDFGALWAMGQDPVQIQPGSPVHDQVVVSMVAVAPPSFTWAPPP
jgi:hypothetical protein